MVASVEQSVLFLSQIPVYTVVHTPPTIKSQDICWKDRSVKRTLCVTLKFGKLAGYLVICQLLVSNVPVHRVKDSRAFKGAFVHDFMYMHVSLSVPPVQLHLFGLM